MDTGQIFDFLRRENKRRKAVRTFMASSSSTWKASYFFLASGREALKALLNRQLFEDAALGCFQNETWLK